MIGNMFHLHDVADPVVRKSALVNVRRQGMKHPHPMFAMRRRALSTVHVHASGEPESCFRSTFAILGPVSSYSRNNAFEPLRFRGTGRVVRYLQTWGTSMDPFTPSLSMLLRRLGVAIDSPTALPAGPSAPASDTASAAGAFPSHCRGLHVFDSTVAP